MILYHGSDHIIQKPQFGIGKADNDYGSGFYTTMLKDKADQWALVNGTDTAITNKYQIDPSNLNVLNLDDYGTLSWIAEIACHRGARGERASIVADALIEKYKINTDQADIIIGYRADDSYIDVVDSFLRNELSLEEVDRLFRKGELGQQVFIKSEKAFNALKFQGYEMVTAEPTTDEVQARIDVSRFLRNRLTEIQLNGYVPYGITATEAIQKDCVYNAEYRYYEAKDPTEEIEDYDLEEEGWEPGDD